MVGKLLSKLSFLLSIESKYFLVESLVVVWQIDLIIFLLKFLNVSVIFFLLFSSFDFLSCWCRFQQHAFFSTLIFKKKYDIYSIVIFCRRQIYSFYYPFSSINVSSLLFNLSNTLYIRISIASIGMISFLNRTKIFTLSIWNTHIKLPGLAVCST